MRGLYYRSWCFNQFNGLPWRVYVLATFLFFKSFDLSELSVVTRTSHSIFRLSFNLASNSVLLLIVSIKFERHLYDIQNFQLKCNPLTRKWVCLLCWHQTHLDRTPIVMIYCTDRRRDPQINKKQYKINLSSTRLKVKTLETASQLSITNWRTL